MILNTGDKNVQFMSLFVLNLCIYSTITLIVIFVCLIFFLLIFNVCIHAIWQYKKRYISPWGEHPQSGYTCQSPGNLCQSDGWQITSLTRRRSGTGFGYRSGCCTLMALLSLFNLPVTWQTCTQAHNCTHTHTESEASWMLWRSDQGPISLHHSSHRVL